jgi:uncharacterized RDD family membrane protein YckC
MLILLRGLAATIDAAFVLTYAFCVSFVVTYFGFVKQNSPALSASVFAFLLLYYGCLDAGISGGGTVGKRLCGLIVANDKNFPIPIYRSIGRTAVKVGIPVLLFKLGGNVAMFRAPFIGTATMIAALIAVPVSVIVGRGSFGFHDYAATTCIARLTRVGPIRRMEGRRYVSLVLIIVAAVSLSMTAWLRSLIPLNNLTLRSFVDANTQTGEIEKEFLRGKGSELVRPFVRHIAMLPSAWDFPTDYTKSYTKVPEEWASEFRNTRGAGVIAIELGRNAVEQRFLEQALLQRVMQIWLPRLGHVPRSCGSRSIRNPASVRSRWMRCIPAS